MKNNTYFRKNFTPSLYLLSRKFRGQSRIGDYFRVVRDGLLPGRALYPRLVMVMTTFCTLRCRDCNNLMPCYGECKDASHFDPKTLLRDLDRVLSNIDTLTELELIGGEPFVYPHLAEILDRVLSNKKILFVSLTSNGTVIPKEDILKRIASPRVRVELSDYGQKSQKLDKVTQVFDGYGIRYDRNDDLTWVSPGGTEKRGKSIAQLTREYQSCFSFRYCNTLLGGRIYHCSRAAHLTDLGFVDYPEDSFDVNLKADRAGYRKALRDYWLAPYTMACDHCDHALGNKVESGVQVQRSAPAHELASGDPMQKGADA